jgi:monoamine oxidase
MLPYQSLTLLAGLTCAYELTQTTHHFGWIQGAMESGLRAAQEVHAAQ